MVSCLGIVLMNCQFMVWGMFMMKVTPPLCGLQCFNIDIWCYLNTWEADLILNVILDLLHDYPSKTNHGLLYQVSWLNQYLFPGGCWKVLPGVNYCFKALFMKGIILNTITVLYKLCLKVMRDRGGRDLISVGIQHQSEAPRPSSFWEWIKPEIAKQNYG